MQAAIIFDQAPFVGTFASHIIFMGLFLYLMRKMEKFFEASGHRTVTCKFYKKMNPRKMRSYIHTLTHVHSTVVTQGEEKGEYSCEVVVKFTPPAPFPWTWHGHAPQIQMRVDLENGLLISVTFKRGESLSFWKWLIYNQLLRRSQKMSMIAHHDEHMVDRLIQNLTEADVFTEWVPEEEEEVHLIAEPLGYVWIEVGSRRPKPGTELIHKGLAAALLHKVHFNEEEFELLNIDPSDLKVDSYVKTGPIWKPRYFKVVPPPEEFQEITVSADDEYNPLDVLEIEGQSHGAELESVDVDEWGGTEARGATAGESDPASRGSTPFGSKSKTQNTDEEGGVQNGSSKETKKSGFSDLFRRRK